MLLNVAIWETLPVSSGVPQGSILGLLLFFFTQTISLHQYPCLILGLPFKTDTRYETTLASLKMLPLCYWHEYLDTLFLFKCAHGLIKTDVVPEQVANQAIDFRSRNSSLFSYKIPKVRKLGHQKGYMVRVSRVWYSLPDDIRNPDISFMTFKAIVYSNITFLQQ